MNDFVKKLQDRDDDPYKTYVNDVDQFWAAWTSGEYAAKISNLIYRMARRSLMALISRVQDAVHWIPIRILDKMFYGRSHIMPRVDDFPESQENMSQPMWITWPCFQVWVGSSVGSNVLTNHVGRNRLWRQKVLRLEARRAQSSPVKSRASFWVRIAAFTGGSTTGTLIATLRISST